MAKDLMAKIDSLQSESKRMKSFIELVKSNSYNNKFLCFGAGMYQIQEKRLI